MLIAAVDVGSARARAGLYDAEGRLVARAGRGFATLRDGDGQAGFDLAEIWQAVAEALAEARRMAGASPARIQALAFDATCSLVLRTPEGAEVIAWHDHRAHAEAARLGAIPHEVVRRAGGTVSPEMQTPRLMWLSGNRPDIWARLVGLRDLCDELAFLATGRATRSVCATAAKWPWLPDHGGWAEDLLARLGIGDFPRAEPVLPAGTAIGPLSARGAAELGLERGCIVAAGLIDAFAGALGAATGMAVLIAGTSNCVMAPGDRPVASLWGPYPGAILPGEAVIEGGQSATGALLEAIRALYPDAPGHEAILDRIARAPEPGAGIHVLPDMRGNRAPFGDPLMRGVIHGLGLGRDDATLDALYWRAAVGVALGTRQILDQMGPPPGRLAIAGGQARSGLMRQLYADATGAEIHWQPEDAVLRGTAIAAAAPRSGGIRAARARFAREARITRPDPAGRARREADRAIFLRMQAHRAEITAMQTAMQTAIQTGE